MKNVSIDIAERNGFDFRLRLWSAERLIESATALALGFLNTPGSRSSALLVAVTRLDHRCVPGAADAAERDLECVFRPMARSPCKRRAAVGSSS